MPIALSIVVPVKDEAGNAGPLAREIMAAVGGDNTEIIFVDDASTDRTAEDLLALKGEIAHLRIIRHGRNAGQSRAIRTGVMAAQGAIIANWMAMGRTTLPTCRA